MFSFSYLSTKKREVSPKIRTSRWAYVTNCVKGNGETASRLESNGIKNGTQLYFNLCANFGVKRIAI
ncbi:hypothetical protein VroAM7_15850 [Vibrio rotiferianus]|uniref:Uncharacterized protein n=1 Tax=Vibrio rotiferianus TaxID=190895 RepID=A0A510I5B7_9VIBR|nr:hypothetical protein VroAM7_15850 [Vibrio rotiferianus]